MALERKFLSVLYNDVETDLRREAHAAEEE